MQENYYALFLALISPQLIRSDDAFRSLAYGKIIRRKRDKRKDGNDVVAGYKQEVQMVESR